MVSTETLMPSNSNSFSAASVGPKSRYLSFRSNAIRVRTPSARRLFEARPRWRETTPASPCFFHACTRRLNWRTLIPSRSDASRCPKHSSNVWRTRCARSRSTMLIHNPNSTIRPPTAAATKRGHSNFGRWGHSYLGLTPVGWTLTYEMLFYILVAGALLIRAPLGRVCIPVLLAFAAIAFVGSVDGFATTIVVEFIFGVAIGNAVPWLQSLPKALSAAVAAIAFALLLGVPGIDGLARPLTWGLPAACIVAAVVSIEMAIRQHLPRWLLEAGNASYATYLTHGFAVPAVFVLCARSVSLDRVGLGGMIICCLVASAVAGQITHIVVERPLLLRLRTRRPLSTVPAPG